MAGSMFVLSISSWYLLRGRNLDFAKKSFRIAVAFGMASVLCVIVLGDESGYSIGKAQQTKMATIEAMWETEPPPASFNLIAAPNEAEMKNDFAIHIPWVMGIIGTRSLDTPIPGIKEIIADNRTRIEDGRHAVLALERLRENPEDAEALTTFKKHQQDLGFGLLLKAYMDDVSQASDAEIALAARQSVPRVTPMFWTFRIMVACGFAMLILVAWGFWYSVKGNFADKRIMLRCMLLGLPLPWIAIECGWFVAEYGRQPWTVYGVLPTSLSASSLTTGALWGSIGGFVGFYTILMIVEVYLMQKYVRQGPGSLGTGRYDHEAAH